MEDLYVLNVNVVSPMFHCGSD